MSLIEDFPFLATHTAFKAHLADHFDVEQRGNQFVKLVYALMESWAETDGLRLEIRDGPNDGSRDIVGVNAAGDVELVVEAKFSLPRAATVRKVFDDWYVEDANAAEGRLFGVTSQPIKYVLTTLDDIEALVSKELSGHRNEATRWVASLREADLFKLLDGPRLVKMIKDNFERQFGTDIVVQLNSEIGWPRVRNTRIGVVDAAALANVRDEVGEALIFENVRPFIGGPASGKGSSVNTDIVRSATDAPEQFLARNNGVVFKASSTETHDEDPNLLTLHGANIVNGGQTTHCLLEAGVRPGEAQVLVKVVETSDAWDITESANNQNRVPQVDLKIARFVRPQQVARDSARLGHSTASGYEDVSQLSRLVNPMSSVTVDVDEIRALFIGTFSNDPHNAISANYDRLQASALDADLDGLIAKLIDIQQMAADARVIIEERVDGQDWNVFKRFHKQGNYRAHHTLLALAVALDRDLKKLSGAADKLQFIEDATDLGADEKRSQHFTFCFQLAWQQLVEVGDLRRSDDLDSAVEGMTSRVGQSNFTYLFDAVRRRKLDVEAAMALR